MSNSIYSKEVFVHVVNWLRNVAD